MTRYPGVELWVGKELLDENIYGYFEEEGSQQASLVFPKTQPIPIGVPQRFHSLLPGKLKGSSE